MKDDRLDMQDMPKARRVATRIILGVWTFLAIFVVVMVIALVA
jgi:hypothetical protein